MRVKLPRGVVGRRRYVAFTLVPYGPQNPPSRSELERSMAEAALYLFGILGSADLDFSIKFYSSRSGRGVLKTDNRSLPYALTILMAAAAAAGPFTLEVDGVSGTLRGLAKRSRSPTKTL